MTNTQKLNVSLVLAFVIALSVLLIIIKTAYNTGKSVGVQDARVSEQTQAIEDQYQARRLTDSTDSAAMSDEEASAIINTLQISGY